MSKEFQLAIMQARKELRDGLVIQAYDRLGRILEIMENERDAIFERRGV